MQSLHRKVKLFFIRRQKIVTFHPPNHHNRHTVSPTLSSKSAGAPGWISLSAAASEPPRALSAPLHHPHTHMHALTTWLMFVWLNSLRGNSGPLKLAPLHTYPLSPLFFQLAKVEVRCLSGRSPPIAFAPCFLARTGTRCTSIAGNRLANFAELDSDLWTGSAEVGSRYCLGHISDRSYHRHVENADGVDCSHPGTVCPSENNHEVRGKNNILSLSDDFAIRGGSIPSSFVIHTLQMEIFSVSMVSVDSSAIKLRWPHKNKVSCWLKERLKWPTHYISLEIIQRNLWHFHPTFGIGFISSNSHQALQCFPHGHKGYISV